MKRILKYIKNNIKLLPCSHRQIELCPFNIISPDDYEKDGEEGKNKDIEILWAY